ncbi:DUF6301 family protein [Catellatospora sp. NPDC049133]|uniref:DUF6301 family protein n=1 Tax=Catellatospora sp. NPDC049133 TaxID=3155499 RepID=UPI0033D34167
MNHVRRVVDPPPATVFTVLRDRRWGWSAAEVPALAERLGWRIVGRYDGGTAFASPPAEPTVKHRVAAARDQVHYVDIMLTVRVPERTERTEAQLDAAFADLVAEAVGVLGPVGGSTGGPVPSRRWRLPYGTVVVTRTSWTVSATWSPPDRRWAAAAEAGGYPPGGWADFAARLRDDLRGLDGVVLLRHGSRIVQLASSYGVLHAEVVADHAAGPEAERLSTAQQDALLGLGWRAPQPPTDPNWTCPPLRHPTPADVDAMTARLTATLRDVLAVERPGHLLVESWGEEPDEPLDLAVCR